MLRFRPLPKSVTLNDLEPCHDLSVVSRVAGFTAMTPRQTAWLMLLLLTVSVETPDCLLTAVVPRPTQPSIPPELVNEDQLWLGRRV